MLCQFCKKSEATIHFTNVIGTRVEKIHICPSCADQKGFDHLKKSNFEKSDILAGLMNLASRPVKNDTPVKRCENCGRDYEDFRKTAKLGCAHCYEVFRKELEKVLTGIHGHTGHKGKVPERYGTRIDMSRRIHQLQKELRDVIELEQYERAAELRDEISSLREEGGD